MKKVLIILLSVLLAIIAGCGSGDNDSSDNTTTVTINLGDMNTIAGAVSSTIPFGIASIRVTVSADDIVTVEKTVPVTGGDSVSITIEILNGPDRHFLMEALDSSGNVLYSGSATADLNGKPVQLAIILTTTTWAKSYGGTGQDSASSIQQTSDGGFIVAGQSSSFSGGSNDFWVLKLKGDGTVQWQKTYSDTYTDILESIQQTSDGGYIVAGYVDTCGEWCFAFWILKLDSDGTIQWQREYDNAPTYADSARSIRQASDGGYIVAGETGSDVWVIKLDNIGSVQWEKIYSVYDVSGANSVRQTSDGGYIVAGYAESSADSYFWVLKLGSNGAVQWQKTYSNAAADIARSIRQTSDGGYIVAGMAGTSSTSAWVLKLDADGSIQWEKLYSGSVLNAPVSVQQTSDSGYVIAGQTNLLSESGNDFWILRLNSSGDVQWQKAFGGTGSDIAYAVQQTSDGNFIVAGATASFGAGSTDFWILNMLSNGTVNFNASSGAMAADTSATVTTTSASVNNTSATVTDSTATVSETNATVADTSAIVQQQGP